MTIPELPPLPLLVATLAVALTAGLARGFSGFGSALIFIPLASAALGPQMAAATLVVVDNVTTLPLLPAAWRRANRKDVGALAAGALVGTPIGTWLLLRMDPVALRWGMCVLVVAMLVLLASGWRFRGKPALPLSLGVGLTSGFCSGASQMGGPPVVAYWLGGTTPMVEVRANIVLYFAASGLISTTAYLLGGVLDSRAVILAGMVLPVYALGVWGGARLFGLASEASFRRACFMLIALAALLGLPLWDHLR